MFKDDVPIAVYDGLINAVREGIPPLLRYYELRQRVLDLDQLRAYDTYVPLVPEIETHIGFDDATVVPLHRRRCDNPRIALQSHRIRPMKTGPGTRRPKVPAASDNALGTWQFPALRQRNRSEW